MKKALLIGLVSVLIPVNCFAISFGDGLKDTGLKEANSHSHVFTSPVKIFAMVVTPTANNGFAQLIETNSARQDTNAPNTDGIGLEGEGFRSSPMTKVKADVQGATAGNTVSVEWEDGLEIFEQTFLDCKDAQVNIYYKQ